MTTQAFKTITAITIGKRFVQQNPINWSYLNLGKVALTQTNKKQNKDVFKPKIIDWRLISELFINISGKLQPPKNNIAVIELNKTILEYSLRKKKTKGTELCSTKKPATSSDSEIYSFNIFTLLYNFLFINIKLN
jgi:hypothetical protein